MIDENKLIEELKKSCDYWQECYGIDRFYSLKEMAITHSAKIEEVRNIISLIKKQPKISEWIPCSERLPENENRVLATLRIDDECHTIIARYIRGSWTPSIGWLTGNEEIIAWMPIPEPWKGETDE